MELNPNHPTTGALSDHWPKVVAMIMRKLGAAHVVIERKDFDTLDAAGLFITVQELEDGLHLYAHPKTHPETRGDMDEIARLRAEAKRLSESASYWSREARRYQRLYNDLREREFTHFSVVTHQAFRDDLPGANDLAAKAMDYLPAPSALSIASPAHTACPPRDATPAAPAATPAPERRQK